MCMLFSSYISPIFYTGGSGGTAAGLAIGMYLSGMYKTTKLHAVGVCDNPEYFYNHIKEVAVEMGLEKDEGGAVESKDKEGEIMMNIREFCHIYAGQGIGYAKSTTEELAFIVGLAKQTGIVLDPVYSGKVSV